MSGMDRHLGLDLAPGRHGREALDKAPGESAVTGEDVGEPGAEEPTVQPVEQTVAKGMTGPSGIVSNTGPSAYHHIEAVADQPLDKHRGLGGIVGTVAVGQNVDVGIDLCEHTADHAPLARHRLVAHDSSGVRGPAGRVIGRGVVANVDLATGQRGPESGHYVADGGRLV